MNGVYEIPSNVFSVIDDDINEIEQSFAVIAEIRTDVPDVCFQIQVNDTNCYGRSGATEIRIRDNDRKLISELNNYWFYVVIVTLVNTCFFRFGSNKPIFHSSSYSHDHWIH